MTRTQKALNVLYIVAMGLAIFNFAMSLHSTDTFAESSDTYTLVDVYEYEHPIGGLNSPMYRTRLTFRNSDGDELVVKTMAVDKYVTGHKYIITRTLLPNISTGNSVKIEEA